jgi:hypothetical protein
MLVLYMKRPLEKMGPQEVREATAEPPVVARLVIEIRSDGSHTVARGMAEDVAQGERVEVRAEGSTPFGLVLSLLKSLQDIPVLARGFAKGLLKR